MASGFKVFLISPLRVVIYSFTDHNSVDHIYNAGSLEPIWNPKVDSFVEISGVATSRFEVNPVLVGYNDDTFEILYAPPRSAVVLRADGTPAHPRGRQVTVISRLLIPDLSRSYVGSRLTPLPLAEPNLNAVQKYIDLSRVPEPSVQLNNALSPDQHEQMLAQPISVPVGVNSIDSPSCSYDSPRETPAKSPTPRMKIPEIPLEAPSREKPHEKITDNKEYQAEIKRLQEEIDELRSMLKAFVQRTYKIYPVDCPVTLRVDKKNAPVIKFEEAQAKLSNNEIERCVMDPLLQAYAGSARNNNRLVTLFGKNGEVYHVRADYDPKDNKINPPK